MENFKLLIVDDEETFIEVLRDRLTRKGLNVKAVTSGLDAIKLVEEEEFDVALFDIMMDKINGLELLAKVKKIQPNMEVIMLTGYGTIESAIEAMRKGAYDYLSKPVNPIELELVLKRAAEKKRLQGYNESLVENIKLINDKKEIIGESPVMMNLKYIIEKACDSHLPVLILGESGTGKDLVANALHYKSCRRDKPFIPINAGAIPGELLESELFGHVKGAFTGAHTNKKGLVEIANGGTLFLDEIGDMDPSLQVKLLRFLDTGEFRPVGGTMTKKTTVRVVTATNKNLEEAIYNGSFREDLFYRLSVVTISVPPLRKRGNDILILANYFLNKNLNNKKELREETKRFLLEYDFPGNVRELANFIDRGVLLSKGNEIFPRDLLPNLNNSETPQQKYISLDDVEKEHISNILKLVDWDKPEAAKMLNIGLRTLYRKIEKYKLEP
ncbi:two component, sigma54 specific, transcriptional regulator, Fis family [Tissierella praeacuta DSM 18095]|uniref:Two component, sigma54 specific, transcriptional regulator, Fis family n=1 Tax=Tissierella praeacuta DSM 18095 TaxID=1123404 RepID=A0A1M4TMT4_9FIRM|nr:sigma-54 dependent transcriptional regulator [Tissierella praeacuta]SHE45587.1 two component, sigma54 specific, transcriptional regulator, Fis family [Tissierella praeacuta DSM 18095]SUP04500.1 Transcriptional regulatory protein ZraR [Tissierella praeacuta]